MFTSLFLSICISWTAKLCNLVWLTIKQWDIVVTSHHHCGQARKWEHEKNYSHLSIGSNGCLIAQNCKILMIVNMYVGFMQFCLWNCTVIFILYPLHIIPVVGLICYWLSLNSDNILWFLLFFWCLVKMSCSLSSKKVMFFFYLFQLVLSGVESHNLVLLIITNK